MRHGDIWTLFHRADKFSFSDLSQTKLRPAVVLASVSKDDWILCQITSNQNAGERAVQITSADFAQGSLLKTSYARPNKIFTAHEKLIVRRVGILKNTKIDEIIASLTELLQTA
jgi:mRNA interferase MazF